MILDLLKKLRDKAAATANFVLGPWMRRPDKSIPLFNALIGYAVMLTMGCFSRALIAKLLTWGVLLTWNVVREFTLEDLTHPIEAAKTKVPHIASYHIGAALGFLLSSIG